MENAHQFALRMLPTPVDGKSWINVHWSQPGENGRKFWDGSRAAFRSTPPRRGDFLADAIRALKDVSIHAPVKGRHVDEHHAGGAVLVSIHVPVKGRQGRMGV